MASKQGEISIFELFLGKVKLKKWAKVFFECIPKPRTAREIMVLRGINDLSNAKKHLNEAEEEGFLDSWTEPKGKTSVRYWYVTDEIYKRLIVEGIPKIKQFKRMGKRNLQNMFDVCFNFDRRGLTKARKDIYEDFKAKYG